MKMKQVGKIEQKWVEFRLKWGILRKSGDGGNLLKSGEIPHSKWGMRGLVIRSSQPRDNIDIEMKKYKL